MSTTRPIIIDFASHLQMYLSRREQVGYIYDELLQNQKTTKEEILSLRGVKNERAKQRLAHISQVFKQRQQMLYRFGSELSRLDRSIAHELKQSLN